MYKFQEDCVLTKKKPKARTHMQTRMQRFTKSRVLVQIWRMDHCICVHLKDWVIQKDTHVNGLRGRTSNLVQFSQSLLVGADYSSVSCHHLFSQVVPVRRELAQLPQVLHPVDKHRSMRDLEYLGDPFQLNCYSENRQLVWKQQVWRCSSISRTTSVTTVAFPLAPMRQYSVFKVFQLVNILFYCLNHGIPIATLQLLTQRHSQLSQGRTNFLTGGPQ